MKTPHPTGWEKIKNLRISVIATDVSLKQAPILEVFEWIYVAPTEIDQQKGLSLYHQVVKTITTLSLAALALAGDLQEQSLPINII